MSVPAPCRSFFGWYEELGIIVKKVGKGVWRMPWLVQAMKDVISCDKLRVGAHDL